MMFTKVSDRTPHQSRWKTFGSVLTFSSLPPIYENRKLLKRESIMKRGPLVRFAGRLLSGAAAIDGNFGNS